MRGRTLRAIVKRNDASYERGTYAYDSLPRLLDVLEAAQFIDECAGRGDIESHVLGAGSPLRRLRAALAALDEAP